MKATKLLVMLIALGGLTGLLGSRVETEATGAVTGKVPRPQNALVFLDKVPGDFNPNPDERAMVDQEHLKFMPKVLVVLQGATVEFRNSDTERHNVFGVGREEFDLGTWTQGITRTHTFQKVGSTALLCNVHPEMEGHVLVLQNPFYTQPDSSGNFTLKNVPPGEYNVIYWRPNLKPKKKHITVGEGLVTVDFK